MNKPVISYVSNFKTIQQQPIIVNRNGSLYTNKQELTDFMDLLYVHPKSDTYIYVKCHCGKEYQYKTKIDVPENNTNCICGKVIFKYNS